MPETVHEIRALLAESGERDERDVVGQDTERSTPIEDMGEAIWELGDAVEDLRSGEVVWSGLERERLLIAVEKSLAAYRTGAVSAVSLDALALLGVIRGVTSRAVESEVDEAAKAHTRSAMADPGRGGRAGAFLFGICGMDNKVTCAVDEVMALEIERAYVAGAALKQSNGAVNVDERLTVGEDGQAGAPEQWAEEYAVEKLGDEAAHAARDVVRDAFLAGYLVGVLGFSNPPPSDARLHVPSLQPVIAPEVLRGFRAMACSLTAPQAEHPDVQAACEWLAADSSRAGDQEEALDSAPSMKGNSHE